MCNLTVPREGPKYLFLILEMFILCFALAGFRKSVSPTPVRMSQKPPFGFLHVSLPPFAGAAVTQSGTAPPMTVSQTSASPPRHPASNNQWDTGGGDRTSHTALPSVLCSYPAQDHHRCSLYPDFTGTQHWGGIDCSWGVSWALYNISDDLWDPSLHIPRRWPKEGLCKQQKQVANIAWSHFCFKRSLYAYIKCIYIKLNIFKLNILNASIFMYVSQVVKWAPLGGECVLGSCWGARSYFKKTIVYSNFTLTVMVYRKRIKGFPGGAVVKNPPANAGDTGSSPGPGRSHVPRSN